MTSRESQERDVERYGEEVARHMHDEHVGIAQGTFGAGLDSHDIVGTHSSKGATMTTMPVDHGPRWAIAKTISDGGGTFYADTLTDAYLTVGYVVGVGGAVIDLATGITPEDFGRTAQRVAQEFDTTYVGTWVDGGKLYIDAVVVIADAGRAFDLALAKGQEAIYDVANGIVLPVKGMHE